MLSSSSSLGCHEAEPLLSLSADGEVAPEDQALLEDHLVRCARCRDKLAELEGLKRALRRRALDETPLPPALLARVQRDLRQAAKGERRRSVLVVAAPVFAGLGAVFFVSASLIGLFGARPFGGADERALGVAPALVEEALSLHTLDVPVDVASPDPARVGAFLSSRIGHPVRVPRLDPAGFGLAGARVINVHNQRAAQLFYEGGLGHRVSLVAVPDPEGRLAVRVRDGAESVSTSSVTFADWVKGGHDEDSAHLRARRGELAVHVWSGKGTVYSLAGKLDDDRLDSLLSEVTMGSRRPTGVQRVAREMDPPLR